MTEIPGTGKVSKPKDELTNIPETPLSIVNTKKLEKENLTTDEKPKEIDKIQYWIFSGVLLSLLFVAISIKYRRFWVFIPVGPTTAIIAWYIRSLINKLEPKPKRYSH